MIVLLGGRSMSRRRAVRVRKLFVPGLSSGLLGVVVAALT